MGLGLAVDYQYINWYGWKFFLIDIDFDKMIPMENFFFGYITVRLIGDVGFYIQECETSQA